MQDDIFTNIDERYGNREDVTIHDYIQLNPDGEFILESEGIYELTDDNTWLLVAERQ